MRTKIFLLSFDWDVLTSSMLMVCMLGPSDVREFAHMLNDSHKDVSSGLLTQQDMLM